MDGVGINVQSWDKKRKWVWERDGGVCDVCLEKVKWDKYHLGHIVDRVAGGSDDVENVAVMCAACNMLKPIHYTKQDYVRWLCKGGWFGELCREFEEKGYVFNSYELAFLTKLEIRQAERYVEDLVNMDLDDYLADLLCLVQTLLKDRGELDSFLEYLQGAVQ